MTTALATAEATPISAAKPRTSLVAKMAERFNVEPSKLMVTLKSTAFKSEKQVTDEQMMALLIVADQYKLNPFTKELFAFPDKGGIVPVVSVDGWARIINEHPQFDGVSFTYDDADKSMTCVMHRKDRSHPTELTEYMAECKRGTQPWNSHPRRMLRHKALIQCARVAFGFAGIYDEDEADRIRHMGPADEVKPEGGSVAAVRAAVAEKRAAGGEFIDMESGEVTQAAPTDNSRVLVELKAGLDNATGEETAALFLDQARDVLPPAEHAELAKHFEARWSAKA